MGSCPRVAEWRQAMLRNVSQRSRNPACAYAGAFEQVWRSRSPFAGGCPGAGPDRSRDPPRGLAKDGHLSRNYVLDRGRHWCFCLPRLGLWIEIQSKLTDRAIEKVISEQLPQRLRLSRSIN